MQPFRIISVQPKQPARKRRTVKLVATAKPRPRRKGKPAIFANQAEEWVAFALLFAADAAQRRRSV